MGQQPWESLRFCFLFTCLDRIHWKPERSGDLQKARSRLFWVTLWEQREVPWRSCQHSTWIGSEAEMRGNVGDLRLCFVFFFECELSQTQAGTRMVLK